MKTYWLIGKKEVGGEAAQSYMSFVGGSHPTAISQQSEDGISNSTLVEKLPGGPIPEEDESITWPLEEDEVISSQKDSPVAYYGHVPHTPHNDGTKFHWEKVWKPGSFVWYFFN